MTKLGKLTELAFRGKTVKQVNKTYSVEIRAMKKVKLDDTTQSDIQEVGSQYKLGGQARKRELRLEL